MPNASTPVPKNPRSRRLPWLVAAATALLLTFTCLLVYGVAQQSLRLGADAAPAALAAETRDRLATGFAAPDAVPSSTVRVESSLSPFVLVYDAQGNLVASSGTLDGAAPVYPAGARAAAAASGENRVTWQPRSGLRFASVVLADGQGVVVAAQSLAEPERSIGRIGRLVFLAWACGMACAALLLAGSLAIGRRG